MFFNLAVVSLLASSALATYDIASLNDKEIITGGYDYAAMDKQLLEYLPTKNYTKLQWLPGYIPGGCMNSTKKYGYDASDIDVFTVNYEDCDEPWVICRHKDSPVVEDDIFSIVSRLPVGMRQYIKNLVAFPGSNQDGAAAITTEYSVINVWGKHWTIGILIHESSHVLDALALRSFIPESTAWFSSTPLWQDAEEKDYGVPTHYAQANWQENFAEAGRVAMSDMVVPGGLPAINKNSPEVSWQVTTYEMYLRSVIFPGSGNCTAKTHSGYPVPVVDGAKFSADSFGPVPNTTLTGGQGTVPEIIVPVIVAPDLLEYHED